MAMLMMIQISSNANKLALDPSSMEHTLFCKHCKIKLDSSTAIKSQFCCRGCETAWALVHSLNLEQYYKLAENNLQKPAFEDKCDYSIFDSEEFQAEFVIQKNQNDSPHRSAKVLIDNITCYACIWLIRHALKKNFSFNDDSSSVMIDINQSTGTATIYWNTERLKLSKIVQFIASMGYRVLPQRGPKVETDQAALIKVGVGLFVMMNVMSFAMAEYFAGENGLEISMLLLLRWFSLLLTTIALGWTGKEFFLNTYRSIKALRPHIDAPILVGLIGAFVYSIKNTILLNGPVYFDSITAIIALVQSGRFIQQNILKRSQSKMASLLNPREGWALTRACSEIPESRREELKKRSLLKVNEHFSTTSNAESEFAEQDLTKIPSNSQSTWTLTPIHKIKAGDLVRVLPGELMPIRAICTSTCADISYEQLRGEAHWKTIKSGDVIPAGAVNGPQPIEFIADQNGSESYLSHLSKSIHNALEQKGIYQQWSDRAAWWLFLFVFSTATLTMIVLGQEKLDDAVSRSIAIFLVACPCTFAMGAPLAFGTAMTQALRQGILFKSQRALEKLADIRHFIFDKTGTLTNGTLEISDWHWLSQINSSQKIKVFSDLQALKNSSHHQISQAIAKFSETQMPNTTFKPFSAKEILGQGIKLEFQNDIYHIGSRKFLENNNIEYSTVTCTCTCNSSCSCSCSCSCSSTVNSSSEASAIIALNGKAISYLVLDDTAKHDTHLLLNKLLEKDCSFELLSGDSSKRTKNFAQTLTKQPVRLEGNASPTSKINRIKSSKKNQPVAMIGNGLNDAGAMAHSTVSISTYNASSTAQNASDICLLQNEMILVNTAHEISKYTIQKIRTIFVVSVGYNLLGLGLAASGHISPVIAAILMPISSITITLIATRWNPQIKNNQINQTGNSGSTGNGSTILTNTY